MNTPSLLLVIFPISNIFFSDIRPVHCPHSTFYIGSPFPLKKITRRIVIHFPVTVLHIILEVTLEDTSTFKDDFSFALLFSINPISLIRSFINCILSVSMPKPVFDLALISTSIWPFVKAFSSDTIICKFSSVYNSISPSKSSLSAQ